MAVSVVVLLSLCYTCEGAFPRYPTPLSLNDDPVPKEYQQQLGRRLTKHEELERRENAVRYYDVLKEQAMSVDLRNVEIETYSINLTAACQRDFRRFIYALQLNVTPHWAMLMLDSVSFFEPGVFQGNFLFEGRYQECISAQQSDIIRNRITGLYCLGYWYEYYEYYTFSWWQKRGQGICIPDTCTNHDAEALIRNVYVPYAPDYVDINMHCERGNDMSDDPEAIISIVIMCLFGVLCLCATLYDAYVRQPELAEDESDGSNVVVTSASTSPTNDTAFETVNHKPNESNTGMTKSGYHDNNGFIGEHDMFAMKQQNGVSNEQEQDKEERANGESQQLGNNVLKLKQAPKESPSDVVRESQRNGFSVNQDKSSEKHTSKAEQLLLAFSLYFSVPLICTSKQPKGAYKCINGIRFLAMAWIILGHTYITGTLVFPPTIENEWTAFSKWGEPIYSKIMEIDLYVDTFFVLSAFLMSISFLRKLNKANGIRKIGVLGMIEHYFIRYWRLTPTYFIVLMVYTNLFHYMGEGPFMKDYLYDVDTCETEWWRNLLYINNLFRDNSNGFCMGWSWYLAVDWQLFCVAPIFLYFLWRYEIFGIILTFLGFCVGIISTAVLYDKLYTQTDGELSDFDDIYIKPYTRCHVYFMGMLLGFYFYKTKGKIKMHWSVVAIGWFVALSLSVIVCYVPILQYCSDGTLCGEWTHAGKVTWNTLNRPLWAVWVCWLILACSTGYGGFVDMFLSWSFFAPLGKLTYGGYLIHSILCNLFMYGAPLQQYYYDYFFVYLFIGNLVITMILALVLVTTVSVPLMAIMAVFLPSMKAKQPR